MAKKKFIIAAIIIAAVALIWFVFIREAVPDGSTRESREEILTGFKGEGWSISTETEAGGYIVSGACGPGDEVSLEVFEPLGGGKYGMQSSVNRKRDEILMGMVMAEGRSYELVWFCGAQTEHADITLRLNDSGEVITHRFDTSDGGIICFESPDSNDFNMQVVYYDKEGRAYE